LFVKLGLELRSGEAVERVPEHSEATSVTESLERLQARTSRSDFFQMGFDLALEGKRIEHGVFVHQCSALLLRERAASGVI